jgi:hypothetical protein
MTGIWICIGNGVCRPRHSCCSRTPKILIKSRAGIDCELVKTKIALFGMSSSILPLFTLRLPTRDLLLGNFNEVLKGLYKEFVPY